MKIGKLKINNHKPPFRGFTAPSLEERAGERCFPIFLSVLSTLSLFMVCWSGPVSEYSGHDYYFNIGRFEVLIQAIRDGQYPIYIDYNTLEGYGYFTKGFYPDLVILPFALIGLATGAVLAHNIMIFTMTFLCGLFMYHAVNSIFKNTFVAAISSILYTFSPYHLYDWYNRSAVGESISFAFLPLVFLGLYHIIAGDYRKWYILTIGYSLLLYTHMLSSFMTFMSTCIILAICWKPLYNEPKRIKYLLLAAAVTLPIVASYLFPLLEQMFSNTFYYESKQNITGQTKLGLSDLIWGILSGIHYPKHENMSGAGPLFIILVILRIFVREKSRAIRIADICTLVGLFYILMMSAIFPWGRLPLGFIQFPSRLYEFVTFFLAIAGGYYLYVILKGNKKLYIAAFSIVIIFTITAIVVGNNNYKYWQASVMDIIPEWYDGVPSVKNQYYQGGLEYLPDKVPSFEYFSQRGDSIKSNHADTEILSFNREKGIISLDVSLQSPDELELPLVYYKGYRAVQNGEKLAIGESGFGLVQVSVDKPGKIEVYYAATPVQKISWYISLISILIFLIYIYRLKRVK